MPRPVFDIKEYELRGIEPYSFSEDHKLSINKTTARVHSQIDWTAQLLGFNGPNYWGKSNPKQDFSYNWVGLVETVDEKRQMQTGAFGVYNKDKDYDTWPAPFNRSDVKASADYSFNIFDDGRLTYVEPLGHEKAPSFMDDPVLIVGGSYIFNNEVEFFPHSGSDQDEEEPSIFVETFYDEGVWTRLTVLRYMDGALEAKIVGSQAHFLPFEVLKWEDISDWKDPQVYKQFLGIWGNKGNNLSFDFAFDALSLHGCDEHYSLFMEPSIQSYTVAELLDKVGLEPTIWTGHNPERFVFFVEGCDVPLVAQPAIQGPGLSNPSLHKNWPPSLLPERVEMGECSGGCSTYVKAWQTLEDTLYDNGEFTAICPPPSYVDYDNDVYAPYDQDENPPLDDFEYHDQSGKGRAYEGFYNRNPKPPYPTDCDGPPFLDSNDKSLDNGTLEDLSTAFIYTSADDGLYDQMPFSGIKGFEFTWEALAPAAILNGVCISWAFDPTLDNGTLEESIHRLDYAKDPASDEWLYDEGPWATASNGVFDMDSIPCDVDDFSTVDAPCEGNAVWCGYDDGEFDQTDEYCDCETFDQAVDPEICYIDPCVIPDKDCDADGGIMTVYGPPRYEEECECTVDCCLVDNEDIPPPPPYTSPNIITGDIYDRYCEPQLSPPPEIELCPVEPLLIGLREINERITLSMLPSIRNSYTPLRLWKNHTLMVTDEVPHTEGPDEYRNFFMADQNTGPEPEDSYRHFVRLPMEYVREGREWNRAVQICQNQSYFSSPDKVSRTLHDKDGEGPTVYYKSYNDRDLNPGVAVYEESYQSSSCTSDWLGIGSGFDDSRISEVDPEPMPYAYAGITEYDEMETRIPTSGGEWRGKYYARGTFESLSGHLTTDLETGALIDTGYKPVYDESGVKRPDTTFADDFPSVKMKDFVVSYAYFMADLSASEDPMFEPTTAHCWRSKLIDNDIVNNDGECEFHPMESNTAYLLHPTTLDYGKRTRESRNAGELTRKAEETQSFFGGVQSSTISYSGGGPATRSVSGTRTTSGGSGGASSNAGAGTNGRTGTNTSTSSGGNTSSGGYSY